MAKVRETVEIARPVPVVFQYVADYKHALDWLDGFDEFKIIGEKTTGVGARVKASGVFFALRVTTELEIMEFVENERFVSVSDGLVASRVEWRFSTTPAGTLVSFGGEYRVNGIPIPPLIGDRLLQMEVSGQTARSLRNLKRILESRPA